MNDTMHISESELILEPIMTGICYFLCKKKGMVAYFLLLEY